MKKTILILVLIMCCGCIAKFPEKKIPGIGIIQLKLGPYENLTYLIYCSETKDAIILDAAFEMQSIISKIIGNGLNIKYIVSTHTHQDHSFYNAEWQEKYNCPVITHKSAGEGNDIYTKRGDLLVEDNSYIEIGKIKLQVIHTPGHSPGSICLSYKSASESYLFTGDTLFAGSVGRTDLLGGELMALEESIKKLYKMLPLEIIIYPGHASGNIVSSTLDNELKNNSYVQQFFQN